MGSLTKQVLVFRNCASLNIYLGRIFRRQHNSRIVLGMNGLQRSAVRCVDLRDSALQLSRAAPGLERRPPGRPAAGARGGTRGHPRVSTPRAARPCAGAARCRSGLRRDGIQLGALVAVLLDALLLCLSAFFFFGGVPRGMPRPLLPGCSGGDGSQHSPLCALRDPQETLCRLQCPSGTEAVLTTASCPSGSRVRAQRAGALAPGPRAPVAREGALLGLLGGVAASRRAALPSPAFVACFVRFSPRGCWLRTGIGPRRTMDEASRRL